MYRFLAILVSVLLISGCACQEHAEICKFGTGLYLKALGEELVSEGVKVVINDGEKICYSKEMWLEGDRAGARAEQYYKGAATLVSSQAHADRIHSWLEHSNREYSESATESGNKFFVVFSGSKEQFRETQEILECLQSGMECK
jgi:hypothetical protein